MQNIKYIDFTNEELSSMLETKEATPFYLFLIFFPFLENSTF